MILRDRIWNDLRNSVYYIEYLSLYIIHLKRINRIIETTFLTTTIIGIIGINKFGKLNLFWSILLSLVVILRILKSRISIPIEKIHSLENLRAFYIDHIRDLDTLWYNHENSKKSSNQIEKEFNRLNEQERLIIKIEKHDKIFGKSPFEEKANRLAREKLKKYL